MAIERRAAPLCGDRHPAADRRRRAAVRRRALALLLALAGCGGAPGPTAPPRLIVAQPTYDFGQLLQGTPIEHSFDLANGGGAPLSIIDLRTGCDCVATLDGSYDLPAGAHATLRLRCDTGRSPGPQRRTVTVYSNDPEHRATVLAATGTVALVAAAEPSRVYLGPVAAGSTAVRQLALRAGDDGVRFLAVEGGAPALRPHLVDGLGGPALILDVAADAPLGPFRTVVRVLTTSPVRPAIEIPVAAIITAAATPTASGGTP